MTGLSIIMFTIVNLMFFDNHCVLHFTTELFPFSIKFITFREIENTYFMFEIP